MAVATGGTGVRALKREISITLVIKARVIPVAWVMAGPAFITATAIVRVVCFMAGETGSRRVWEGAIFVAAQAGRLLMLSEQWVFRGVVIEFGISPFGWLVARRAVVIHRILMRFFVAVTIDALRWRFPVFLVGNVTVAALGLKVSAYEFEVGEGVVEIIFVQDHHISVTTLVIGMAGCALVIAGVRMAPVIAERSRNIRTHIFVTIHTELSLAGLIEHDMAGGTLGLDLGVSFDDIARHDKRLDVLRRGVGKCECSHHHH